MLSANSWLWIGFNIFVLAMLALDLGIFHRKAHAISIKEASIWSLVWIALAMIFNAGIYFFSGPEPALQFFTGYLIEKSLSVDNIFVFVLLVIETTDLIFALDSIPAIFAVTQDPFLVYTSNVFAILGLRSLYFVFANAMGKFHYLKLGLAVVLSFVGAKLILTGIYHISK